MRKTLALLILGGLPALAEPLKVALLWHMHQPPYQDPRTGTYGAPWVRMHGADSYPWMAEVLKDYPQVKVNFNLTPTLIRQIQDYLKGAEDAYERVSKKPLAELTLEEKGFIQERFFDINPKILGQSPRYRELQAKKSRGETFSDQDIQDLRALWNLYWIHPEYVEKDPGLKALKAKDQGFTQEEVLYILRAQRGLLARTLPLYRELAARGQAELLTSPFHHPILPILVDKKAIRESNPNLKVPEEPIAWPEDALWQVEAGRAYFQEVMGLLPPGAWPPEGAVSQKAAAIYARAGVRYLVTDEAILGRSGVPVTPASLARPYRLETEGGPIFIFFRHRDLSDRIGFAYHSMDPKTAVEDFIQTLLEFREKVGPGAVLTIALDGENAWENYPDRGVGFRRLLYQRLAEEKARGRIETILFSEVFDPKAPELERLATGGWAGDFAMWAGEPEENEAWDRLSQARQAVMAYRERSGEDEALRKAMSYIYAAQASDWFWWYGYDTAFPNHPVFDEAFRALLRAVYQAIGQEPPEELYIAVRSPAPLSGSPGRIQPKLDGRVNPGEWDRAGCYLDLDAGTMQTPKDLIRRVCLGYDEAHIYLLVELRDGLKARDLLGQGYRLMVYADQKGNPKGAAFPEGGRQGLGFPLAQRLALDLDQAQEEEGVLVREAYEEGGWVLRSSPADLKGRRGFVNEVLELRIPYSTLGVEAGDTVRLAVALMGPEGLLDTAPSDHPLALSLPQRLQGRPLLEIQDPEGDEHGPGTYTYPLEKAFEPYRGLFDLLRFQILDSGATWTLVFTFKAMTNPWGAPAGFSHQLINLYLDYKPGGRTEPFAPGANVRFSPNHPWDLFIKAAGWPQYGQRVGFPTGEDTAEGILVSSDPGEGRVILTLDKRHFSPEPGQKVCLYLLVGSQDGYGPDHFRPVAREAGPWNLGGARDGYAPRVVDYLWPEKGVQEGLLDNYSEADSRYALLEPHCITWPE